MNDIFYMRKVLELAEKGKYSARPNPCVGALVVKNNQIVGSGFHQARGQSHAESQAILEAGDKACGATLYVNLEPCNHFGLTPPCCDFILNSKIKKVVIANIDNNPKVNHLGINRLKLNNVEVLTGILKDEAFELNKDFFYAYQNKKPYVRIKVATSLDGKIAMSNGESKWITNQKSRDKVQLLRAQSSAIITGSNTVIVDNANLNIRENIPIYDYLQKQLALKYQPLKVVIDSKLKASRELNFFKTGNNLVVHTCKNKEGFINNGNNVNLSKLLEYLFLEHKIISVLIEAGSTLSSEFIKIGLANEVHWFTAPKILGATAIDVFNFNFQDLQDSILFDKIYYEFLDNNLYQVFKFSSSF